MSTDLVEIGVLAVTLVGGAVWVWFAFTGAGRAQQQAADLTKTSTADHAMLQAGADAPHDAAALDQRLRDGSF